MENKSELTVVYLIQHHALAWVNFQLVFVEDLKKLLNAFFRILWSNVRDITGVPCEIAAAKGNESNVLEMIS